MSSIGVTALAAGVRGGERTAVAVVDEALARAESASDLGLILHLAAGPARETAREIDRRVAAGEDPGPLAGVPVLVKDNLCTAGIPTTCASRMLEDYVPPYDATVVARLAAAGAVMLGKANLDEFAMGSSNENSAFGAARNPHDPARVTGGSSGGSAGAVAAGIVPVSLGSDTGGSVRQPAAFCGVLGLKPTYGRVSRYGLVAFASSLDQVGPMAADVDSLVAIYDAMAGPDPMDATSVSPPEDGVSVGDVAGLRVGLVEACLEGIQPEIAARVRAAAEALGRAGARIESAALPDTERAVAAYYLVATAEASSNLARYDGVRYGLRRPAADLESMYRRTRSAGFGPEVRRRILLGTYALSAGYVDAYYGRAERARSAFRAEVERGFADFDLLLLPTTPTTAFELGAHRNDPVAMYREDVFTVLANLTGHPAISVPYGTDARGLPIGVQCMAPAWREDRLFAAARALEGDPAP